jgi:hypothetical protein
VLGGSLILVKIPWVLLILQIKEPSDLTFSKNLNELSALMKDPTIQKVGS